ncbi:hypothetical protein A5742_14710 [Mycolicibacterium fortuitum]|uniref:Amine oxidase domain-containing protein n=1 Tax=Mycolicibacterium fortuitum TaxID=1766 RepID=A0ABD6QC89_MYCFO|nr:hypothetical protein A5742_14710 [Mycolicibacterium fortuitum]
MRVLDAGGRVGGKMSSVRCDRFLVDDGAFFLTSSYRHLLQIVDEIGLGDDIVESPFVSVLRDGACHWDRLRRQRRRRRTREMSWLMLSRQ